MSDKKISELTAATTADGTEPLPIVQSGETKKATGKVVVSGAVSDLAQTWNAAGTTFTGLKLNVTDTASASGSLLLDVQKGGVSQLVLNKSGNLGLGVTPSAWGTFLGVLQFPGGSIFGLNADVGNYQINLGNNAFWDGNNYKYIASTAASYYKQGGGGVAVHTFFTAASGTAGATITFSERASIGNTAFVINEPGNDYDFRIEGDTDTNLLFVDASADAIGVGTTSLPSKFNVAGSITVAQNVSFTGVNALLGNLTGDNASAINFVSGASSNTRSGIALKDSWTGVNNTGGYVSVYVGNGSGNTEAFRASNTGIVFNEAGADYDFRIEGDTDANLLFVDASTDRVGVGTNSPAAKLHSSTTDAANYSIAGSGTTKGFRVEHSATATTIAGVDNTLSASWQPLQFNGSILNFLTGNTERMRLDASGNLGLGVTPSAWTIPAFQSSLGVFAGNTEFNTSANAYYDGAWKYIGTGVASRYSHAGAIHSWYTAISGTAGNTVTWSERFSASAFSFVINDPGNDYDFRVEGDTDANLFFVDASTDRVGIGTNAPARKLDVVGGMRLSDSNVLEWGGTSAYIQGTSSSNALFFGTSSAEQMRINSAGNVLIGGTTAPTTGTKCLSVFTGTAPTATAADSITVYSSDVSAGNTTLSIYTEGTPVSDSTDNAVTKKIAVRINGTLYYLLADTDNS